MTTKAVICISLLTENCCIYRVRSYFILSCLILSYLHVVVSICLLQLHEFQLRNRNKVPCYLRSLIFSREPPSRTAILATTVLRSTYSTANKYRPTSDFQPAAGVVLPSQTPAEPFVYYSFYLSPQHHHFSCRIFCLPTAATHLLPQHHLIPTKSSLSFLQHHPLSRRAKILLSILFTHSCHLV